jgi:hypothetical protein
VIIINVLYFTITGTKSLHSVDSSLSDDDIDDNALSKSGQLSGSGSVVLTTTEATATSLLSKQLENRPDAWANHSSGSLHYRRNKADPVDDHDGHHHKLTREDNSKPIASEKLKKKHVEREVSASNDSKNWSVVLMLTIR